MAHAAALAAWPGSLPDALQTDVHISAAMYGMAVALGEGPTPLIMDQPQHALFEELWAKLPGMVSGGGVHCWELAAPP